MYFAISACLLLSAGLCAAKVCLYLYRKETSA